MVQSLLKLINFIRLVLTNQAVPYTSSLTVHFNPVYKILSYTPLHGCYYSAQCSQITSIVPLLLECSLAVLQCVLL